MMKCKEYTKGPILEVKHLTQIYNKDTPQELTAVDDVSFTINQGETYGLVGESGSGKSTIGRAVVQLFKPTSGEIYFRGESINNIKNRRQRLLFNKQVQMIFQDPYASLNPRMKVRDIIGEGIDIHGIASSKKDREKRIDYLLERVGLNVEHGTRYPHEFSGGQRQRIGIARALSVEPCLIVADEPISALDVSIQAQIINLLAELQQDIGLTYLFIAHDLSMVRYFSDKIGMLYRGRLVETAPANVLYKEPHHPYTQSLLSAIPLPDPDYERERHRIIFDKETHLGREYQQVNDSHFVLLD